MTLDCSSLLYFFLFSVGSCTVQKGNPFFSVNFVKPSKDGGTTWVQASTVGTRRFFEWKGVAMSSDGSQMAACGYGEIWTSMDTGATWLREANFDTDAYLRGGGEDVAWSKIFVKR